MRQKNDRVRIHAQDKLSFKKILAPLLIGLLTRLAAIPLLIIMSVAIYSANLAPFGLRRQPLLGKTAEDVKNFWIALL